MLVLDRRQPRRRAALQALRRGARTAGDLATAYRYTGQRAEPALELYYYSARWYDPLVGRFLVPDAIVPAARVFVSLDYYRVHLFDHETTKNVLLQRIASTRMLLLPCEIAGPEHYSACADPDFNGCGV